MRFTPATALEHLDAEALIAFVHPGASLQPALAAWDAARGGTLEAVLTAGDLAGEANALLPFWLRWWVLA
jgi:hypothetical protein